MSYVRVVLVRRDETHDGHERINEQDRRGEVPLGSDPSGRDARGLGGVNLQLACIDKPQELAGKLCVLVLFCKVLLLECIASHERECRGTHGSSAARQRQRRSYNHLDCFAVRIVCQELMQQHAQQMSQP
jgi:hypothetical protein